MTDIELTHTKGRVVAGFEPVAEEFDRNFVERGEIGAAFCVHWKGLVAVDLSGGVIAPANSEAYGPDTLQLIFSASKGIVAILFSLLAQKGMVEVDHPIAGYWPEFGAAGKAAVTCRQVLAHTAGLPSVRGRVRLREALAWEPVVSALASQPTEWEPGEAHGYHAFTFGWLLGEVLRRVTGASVGELVRSHLAEPLGLDLWIGLPRAEVGRVAPVLPSPMPIAGEPVDALAAAMADPTTRAHAVFTNPPFPIPAFNSAELLEAEVPAANAVTTARSLSRLYAACIGDVEGAPRLLAESTTEALRITESRGPDLVLPRETHYGLGVQLPNELRPLAGEGSFGHYGMGGSVALAHPERRLAAAYVMNQMQSPPGVDSRSASLIALAMACAERALLNEAAPEIVRTPSSGVPTRRSGA